jgi:hypothetical protein
MVSANLRTARVEGEVGLSAGFMRLENRVAGVSDRLDGTSLAFQAEPLSPLEFFSFDEEDGFGRTLSNPAAAAT